MSQPRSTRSTTAKTATTGPLTIAELGRFGFRDGVWYLEPGGRAHKPTGRK